MGPKIFNTLSRKKEPFETIVDGQVRMYICGPTVYDQAHIGHAMSSIVFDVIRRYLEYRGYQVRHVMNYTDVDDKIIARANELGQDPIQLAQRYVEEYERHLHELRRPYRQTTTRFVCIVFVNVAVSPTFSPQACAKPQQLRVRREVDARQFRMRCAQPVVTGGERAVIRAS